MNENGCYSQFEIVCYSRLKMCDTVVCVTVGLKVGVTVGLKVCVTVGLKVCVTVCL